MYNLSVCIWSKKFSNPPSASERFYRFTEQVAEIKGAELVCTWMEDLPFKEHYTAWALNASIRKAKGDFILCTNRDIIFNEILMAFLSSAELRKDTVYRIMRTDVPSVEPYPRTLGDLRRYVQSARKEENGYQDRYLNLVTFPWSLPFSNACGDFILMHRDNWYSVRGFPELRGPAFHIDSLLLYNAIFSGMKQEILKPPMRMYHVNHPRPEVQPIPGLMPMIRKMAVNHKPIILNGENWGLF